MGEFYDRIDAVVVPRFGPSTGVSVKVLEAIEQGVAVVATRAMLIDAGIREAVESISETIDLIVKMYERGAAPGKEQAMTMASSFRLDNLSDFIATDRTPKSSHESVESLESAGKYAKRLIGNMPELLRAMTSPTVPQRVQTVNLHHLHLASRDCRFAEAMERADYLTADGWPLVALLRRRGVEVDRVSGSDFVEKLFKPYAETLRIGLLGASPETGEVLAALAETRGADLAFREHGSCESWNMPELCLQLKREAIDLVLVAVTPPSGEIVADGLMRAGYTGNVIGVGGSIEMLTGSREEPGDRVEDGCRVDLPAPAGAQAFVPALPRGMHPDVHRTNTA